ncbi:hypothetical protein QQG55_39240 [Brugia pahangi]
MHDVFTHAYAVKLHHRKGRSLNFHSVPVKSEKYTSIETDWPIKLCLIIESSGVGGAGWLVGWMVFGIKWW